MAVMLAVADPVRDANPQHTIEFVPFNGKDHALAPGEVAWLAANPGLSDVALAVNIDAAGLRGAPSAYSLYGVGNAAVAFVNRLAVPNTHVVEGPQWPASDHMIFAMRGIPAMAVTSTDFATASGTCSHTPADTPEVLDFEVLAGTARFIAGLMRET